MPVLDLAASTTEVCGCRRHCRRPVDRLENWRQALGVDAGQLALASASKSWHVDAIPACAAVIAHAAVAASAALPLVTGFRVLRDRLVGRGTDAPEIVERRLAEAEEECRHAVEFDFLVVNDDFEAALGDLLAIVRAQRLRMEVQQPRHRALLAGLSGPA